MAAVSHAAPRYDKSISTFDEFQGIANENEVWMLHFTSTKCENAPKDSGSPCLDFAPIFEELSNSLKRIKIAKVDLDDQSAAQMGQQLGINNEGDGCVLTIDALSLLPSFS